MEASRGSSFGNFPSAWGMLLFQGFEAAAAARIRCVFFTGDVDAEESMCNVYLLFDFFCLLDVICICNLAKKKKYNLGDNRSEERV